MRFHYTLCIEINHMKRKGAIQMLLDKTISVDQLIQLAADAQKEYRQFDQGAVDRVVEAMATAATDQAEHLATLAHEETGFGNIKDKTTKNLFASQTIYEYLKDKPSVGIYERDEANKIYKVARPIGVIAALIPMTNPTSTVISKVLNALKARNSIILSPHPRAEKGIIETAKILNEAAVKAGAPDGLIQVLVSPTLEKTQELLHHEGIGLNLATGGTPMVKAAYASGNPTIGVGGGNTPIIIDEGADLAFVAKTIVDSKTFDYGVICSSDQHIITLKSMEDEVKEALKDAKVYFLTPEEAQKIDELIFLKPGVKNIDVVGQPAHKIAKMAGIDTPEDTTLLLGYAPEDVSIESCFTREVLGPVLGFHLVDDFDGAVNKANDLLDQEGKGHTSVLFSNNQDHIEKYGIEVNCSRNLVNTQGVLGSIGAITNLPPSLTLGVGTEGGGSLTHNVAYEDYFNTVYVAFGE
ncbi:acetaldehyde dehydrogenase [Dolosicoccus paucivorans]|uniref:Acetaldehyde dehydrogenase n=2 Tax=Dolosicoccus paucivorans TaxID=84521 RepID=A0A2N6SMC0_9LACT|nr:acetaldehyde dehydrogenase [Dolosicoccus paucivorans]